MFNSVNRRLIEISFTSLFEVESLKFLYFSVLCHLKMKLANDCWFNKKAQLTQGLRATAPSFQDGGCSKMAVSCHLGYYRTWNSAIRSADPKKPCLEPDMAWIGCTVCEIFAFKLYCDLETGVRGHSRSQGHWKLHQEIDRPRKPHTRIKHHVDRQSGCEVMAIFVHPRWPSAAILDFIEPQIAPFDPPTPKTLA